MISWHGGRIKEGFVQDSLQFFRLRSVKKLQIIDVENVLQRYLIGINMAELDINLAFLFGHVKSKLTMLKCFIYFNFCLLQIFVFLFL